LLALLCFVAVAVAFAPRTGRQSCTPERADCHRAAAGMARATSIALSRSVNSSRPDSTLHYTANVRGRADLAASLGFNLFDVRGRTSHPARVRAVVAALPVGGRALVWVGNLDNAPIGSACPQPGFSFAQFAAQVTALAHDPRVFGYYIADEPHPRVCPSAAGDIKARADYIHRHAPGQYAFIVVLDGYSVCGADLGCEYRVLGPSFTDVDYVGLDPYPCHYGTDGWSIPCDDGMIRARVYAAESSGIPVDAIVPVFQTFGQYGRTDGKSAYYRLPSATELGTIFAVWASLVPDPAFDYSYTFGVQCTNEVCPAPQAIANNPSVQASVRAHNATGKPLQ
jgi:hypothetical protein